MLDMAACFIRVLWISTGKDILHRPESSNLVGGRSQHRVALAGPAAASG